MRDQHFRSIAALLAGCSVSAVPLLPPEVVAGAWHGPALLAFFGLGMVVILGRAGWVAGVVLGSLSAVLLIGRAAGDLRAVFYLATLGWHLYGAAALGAATAELGRRWRS